MGGGGEKTKEKGENYQRNNTRKFLRTETNKRATQMYIIIKFQNIMDKEEDPKLQKGKTKHVQRISNQNDIGFLKRNSKSSFWGEISS